MFCKEFRERLGEIPFVLGSKFFLLREGFFSKALFLSNAVIIMLNNKNSLYLLLSPHERCSSFSTISKIPTDIWDSLRSTPSLRRLCKRALPASHSQHCFSPFNCSASPLYSGWLTWYFSFSCGAGGSLFLCTNRTIMKKMCLSSHCLVLLFGPLWYHTHFLQ